MPRRSGGTIFQGGIVLEPRTSTEPVSRQDVGATRACPPGIAAASPRLLPLRLVHSAQEGLPSLIQTATPTADELLAAMDGVLKFDTRTSTATIEVIDARRTRSYWMKSYARGQDDAAVLYLEPAR